MWGGPDFTHGPYGVSASGFGSGTPGVFVEPGWPRPGGADDRSPQRVARTKVGVAVLRNEVQIELAAAAFLSLIEVKLASLRAELPNSDEGISARDRSIADCEKLKRDVEAFLASARGFVAGATQEEAPVEKAAMSIAEGIQDWWTENHVRICQAPYDIAMLAAGLTVCSLADVTGPLAIAVTGALVGGKTVVDAIKAAASLVKTENKSAEKSDRKRRGKR
jgi:hypothetical protein